MWLNYCLLFIAFFCALGGYIFGFRADEQEVKEPEVVEVLSSKDTQWSFRQKDFVAEDLSDDENDTQNSEEDEDFDKEIFDEDDFFDDDESNDALPNNDDDLEKDDLEKPATDTTPLATPPIKEDETASTIAEENNNINVKNESSRMEIPLSEETQILALPVKHELSDAPKQDAETSTTNPQPLTIPVDSSQQIDPKPEIPMEIPLSEENVKISRRRINYLILKARSFLLTNNLEEAYSIAEVVLQSDPTNERAKAIQTYVKQCALEKNQRIPSCATTVKNQLLRNVDETWALPEITGEIIAEQDEIDPLNSMFNRLNRIVIPKISFNNTPLMQAIDTIISLSEQYDTDYGPSEPRGVNIVVMLPQTERDPTITLNLKNMPLDKILNFIAKSSFCQFDIEDDVIVFRKGESDSSENLLTKFFKISRSAIVRITGDQSISLAASPSDKSGKDTKGTNDSNPIAEEERLIKEFLQKAGVNFAGTNGSNLAFDGSQLIITQSLRNMKRVEEILEKYKQIKQVEIETKFIEVEQGALDELQFGWSFASKPEKPLNKHLTSVSFNTHNGGNNNLRTINDAFSIKNAAGGNGSIVIKGEKDTTKTTPIPNSTPNSPGGINLGMAAIDFANITGVIGSKIDLGLTLRALEQQSGSDLMSAPKLTVLSGKTAKITVAQEFIYPKTYGEISSEVGTGDSDSAGVTITAGTPSDFETRNVGVEMTVTPTIEGDNCISLQLQPKVTEFEGFIEYGGRSIAIQGNTSVDVPPGFFQPIFSTREIQTEVTIFDGATVVMGGLTREEIKEVHDKVPLLGDIPLLGKLFRSKGETSQKRNLLIFVTANILSPGGTPIRTQSKNPKEERVYRSSPVKNYGVNSNRE